MNQKTPDKSENNKKLMKMLFESGLAKHPAIEQLLSGALATGNFTEISHYMDMNSPRIEGFLRASLLEEYKKTQNPFYPYPCTDDEIKALSGPIKFGIINPHQNIWFGLHPSDMTMHVMTGGRTGTGKSWGAAFVVSQLAKSDNKSNLVIPDVKTFYRRLYDKVPGLNIIPLEMLKMNLLEIPTWMDPRYFIMQFSKIFASENLLGLPSEGLLTEALHKLFMERRIFEGSYNYCNISDLERMLRRLRQDKSMGNRYRDIFEAVLNRLRPYLYLDDIFCVRKGISHEVFATENVVLELPLDKISNNIHNFIVCWIMHLNFARNIALGLRGNELRTLYLIDEATTILNASREHSGLDWIEPSINTIIAKGREFGLGLWLLSQQTNSFSNIFRANCLLKICFSLTDGEDVTNIQNSFGLNEEQKQFLYLLPKQRAAICRYGDFPRPFLCLFPELRDLDKVPDDNEVNTAMKDFYARILPAKDKESIIRQEEHYRLTNVEIDGMLMIQHLITAPFLTYKELIKLVNLTPTRGDKARAWLVNSGFVKTHSIILRRGKPGEYYELTEQAYQQFGGRPPLGKGAGFEHKLFAYAIKTYVEEKQGFSGRIEGIIDGTSKPIDVLAEKEEFGRLGFEVTLHFNNLMRNIEEDLKTTLKKVIIVCRNKDDLAKAQKIVNESLIPKDRLEFKTIFEFTERKE